jgi:hypothetical protein
MPLKCQIRRYHDERILTAWAQGVSEFRAGRYWEAHERWEQGWVRLPSPDRIILQAAIQVAGALHLLNRVDRGDRGRLSGALSLAATALTKFERIRALGAEGGIVPRVEIEGSEQFLRTLVRGMPLIGREKLVARLIL